MRMIMGYHAGVSNGIMIRYGKMTAAFGPLARSRSTSCWISFAPFWNWPRTGRHWHRSGVLRILSFGLRVIATWVGERGSVVAWEKTWKYTNQRSLPSQLTSWICVLYLGFSLNIRGCESFPSETKQGKPMMGLPWLAGPYCKSAFHQPPHLVSDKLT